MQVRIDRTTNRTMGNLERLCCGSTKSALGSIGPVELESASISASIAAGVPSGAVTSDSLR